MSCMYILVSKRNPYLRLMNRLNSFEQVQHFDVHPFQSKKGKGKKKVGNIQFTTFRNTCNITDI